MSELKMMEAFRALVDQGYMIGFNDFEAGWEAREAAVQAEREGQEPVGYALASSLKALLNESAGHSSMIFSKLACEQHRVDMGNMVAVYTTPPAAPVVDAADLMAAALAASRNELVPGTSSWGFFMQRRLAGKTAAPVVPECEWFPASDMDDMPDIWEGACSAVWTFTDGGPEENTMNFCPHCGGRVRIAAAKQEAPGH